jgi:hypothetical protein
MADICNNMAESYKKLTGRSDAQAKRCLDKINQGNFEIDPLERVYPKTSIAISIGMLACASQRADQQQPCLTVRDIVTATREKCPVAEKITRVEDTHALRLTAEYLAGGAGGAAGRPALRISLRNEALLSIWVNIRMHIDAESQRDKELWLERKEKIGSLASDCHSNIRSLGIGDYMNLDPHAEISIVRSLNCFLDADAPAMPVVVHYKDSSACPIIPGGDWFVGELVSAPVVMGSPVGP